MFTLYSLFLATPTGNRRFVPVHCRSAADLVHQARLLLDEDESACAIEARFGDDVLFTLEKGSSAEH